MPVREELVLDTRQYKRQLKEVERDFERTAKSQEQVFADSGKKAGEEMAEETKKGFLAGIAGVGALVVRRIVGGIKGGIGFIGRTLSSVFDLTALATLGISRGLRAVAQSSRDAQGEMSALGKVANGTASALEKVAKVVLTVSNAIFGMKVAAAAAAAGVAVLASRAAGKLIPSWNRVRTLLGESPEEWAGLRHEIQEVAAAAGRDAPEAMDTFYQILSAMPSVAAEPRRGLELLRTSLDVAATGFGNAEESASALTTILNAFDLEVEESRRVADALFATQDQGVTTFGEVASGIGRVADLTSNLNAEFTDVLGILATVTPQGVETNQVFTQLRGILSNVLKASESTRAEAQRLGIDLSAAGVRAKGLNQFLIDIIETTGGDIDVISKFITSQEGLSLMASLSGSLEDLRTKTEGIEDSAGTTSDKVETMNDDFGRQWDLLVKRLNPALETMGFNLRSLGTDGVSAVNKLFDALAKIDDLPVVQILGRLPLTTQGTEALREREGLLQRWLESRRAAASTSGLPRGSMADQRLPGITARGIRRPAEPTSAEFSEQKIDELERTLEAAALLELARTGDLKEYERALEDAKKQVTELAVAEARRLREAGRPETDVATVLDRADPASLARFRSPGAVRARDAVGRVTPVLEEFKGLLDELPDVSSDFLGFLSSVEAAVTEATDAQREYNLALLEGDPERIAAAEERLADAKENLRDRTKEIIPLLESAGLSEEKMAEIVEWLTENLEDLGVEIEDQGESWEDWAEIIEGVGRGLLSAADAAGVLSDDLRRTLQGVIDVASAVGSIDFDDFFSKGNIGGITQMVGGAIGILSSLFSESPEEKRRQEVLQKNTDALESLRNELGSLRDAIGGARGGVLSGVRSALASVDTVNFPGMAEGLEREVNERLVRDALEQAGVSFEEFEALLRSMGFELDFGAENLEAFNQALQEIELEEFFDGFTGQMELLRREFDLFDIDDPVAKLERLRDIFLDLAQVGGGGLLGILREFGIGQLDLSTEQGRQTLEEIIQRLFREFESGELDLAELGDLTPEQFLDILGQLESAIDKAAGDGGRGTTRSVQIARSITEVQAVEVVAWLEEIAFWVRETTLTLRTLSGVETTRSALSEMSSSPSPASGQASVGGAALVNNGTIMVDPSLSEQQFDQIWTEIGRRIWLESQGSGF